jgi:succinoglycan biosynthesis transport protein ExoP
MKVGWVMSQLNKQQGYNSVNAEIDLRDLFRTLINWRYTIIGITLLCMFLSGIVSFFFLEPVYEAITIVSIDHTYPYHIHWIETGRAITIVSIDHTNFEKQPMGRIEDIVNQMGELPVVTPQSAVQQINDPIILQATIEELGLKYNQAQLANMIKTEQIPDTNLVKIIVSNQDPSLATRIANTVREELIIHINQFNEEKLSTFLTTMENRVLKNEMEALQTANNQLKQRKLESRSIEFLTIQLRKMNEDYADFQSRLINTEIKRDKLQNGIKQCLENLANTPKTITTVSTTDGIISLPIESIKITDGKVISERLNEAYIEAQNLYNNKTAELAETEAEIRKIKEKIRQLEQEIRKLEAELISNQIEEKRLQDEVERREETVKVINSKIYEVKMTEALDLAGSTVLTVSPAVAPEHPVKPNKTLNVAIAGFLGFLISVFGVFLFEYMNYGKQQA